MQAIIVSLFILFAFTSHSAAQKNTVLNIGDKAPKFKTTADDGSSWNVADYLEKKVIVVYFYPAAMTGGCTKQACAYRDMKSEIESTNAVVLGVSGDNVEGLQLFKKAHNLNFVLLSDESGEIATKFGVPMRDGGSITRTIDGQKVELVRGNTASRWTFIIDKAGKIAYKNDAVNAAEDSKQVLEFIKNNR